MNTLSELLDSIKKKFPETQVIFSFPSLYIAVISEIFCGLSDDRKFEVLLDKCCIDEDDLEHILDCSSSRLLLTTTSEFDSEYPFLKNQTINNHWLSQYNSSFRKNIDHKNSKSINVIHFYGQKGGQARSSVVGALARDLSESGHKVLVIDADIEAPTLHTIFGIEKLQIESTLMGYAGWASDPTYTSNPAIPGVYFIGCRPTDEAWEMDYESFSLRCSLDPTSLSDVFKSILELQQIKSGEFDTILVDHRTGTTTSVIPIISTIPGPSVIFSRPDSQTTWLHGIKTLLSINPKNPGAYISFSLDNLKKKGSTTESEAEFKEKLLEILADALAYEAEDPEPLAPDELERFYIPWMYDRAFFNSSLPKISQLQTENIYALNQLKEILGIQKPASKPELSETVTQSKTSSSGIIDETWFVESDMTRAILQHDSNLNYIFGRKGTGKSRLFKESLERGIGLPLLSPSEYGEIDPNIPNSSDIYIKALITTMGDEYEAFWWILVSARLEAERSNLEYKGILQKYSRLSKDELLAISLPHNVVEKLKSRKITLLIDGLETAVPSTKLKNFVEGVLLCMNTVQNSSDIRQKLSIRLFIRVDLAIGNQNIEQQTSGRKIDLYWDEQAQMNYVLACIASNPWAKEKFATTIESIEQHKHDIRLGKLATEACETYLMQIFPENLRRSNIKTITFIKTYFRDASSQDNEHLATFYPRLFLNFTNSLFIQLQRIENPIDENGKVEQSSIFESYDTAATNFINDAKQELAHAIALDIDLSENLRKVNLILDALKGKPTPFTLDTLTQKIHSDIGGSIKEDAIKEALRTMKDMGFFEQTPKDVSKWRAGRVYKSALKMKFVRGIKARE
ncbi:AAA family ATPase [Pseudomonas xanthosomatis]|uniref:tyrosine-protein kinase family protein n=1 Tax=Pseudomonas xanthosomatis TaxID=2842356 RepID=UPI001C3C481D|nr:AAA family ATPase [Pseudomonas xanthosomatis]QXH46032.1 AAA family ATPase [Pseudomonas xanthosomatis]